LISFADIESARERIAGQVAVTPTARCVWLEPMTGVPSYLKLENLQPTGSFKERGALNKLLALSADERERGVVAASAGNHAQAVARHAERLGIRATIVMPNTTPAIKVANTRGYGAKVLLAGANYDEAFQEALKLAAEQGFVYVHAFDDPHVAAGQGTIGLEILQQLPELGTVVVPVGGGGLIGGIALAVKSLRPDVRVVGVESDLVPSMRAALAANQPVAVTGGQTLADGIAVRKVSRLTLELARRFVDDMVVVSEEEIASAVLFLMEREKTVAEGAGAVAVATLLGGKVSGLGERPVCAIIGGGNIDVTMLGKIIDRGLVKDGRMVRLKLRVHDRPGALAEVLAEIARLRGNIVEVQHERAFTQTLYGDVDIFVTLETEGQAHIAQILEQLDPMTKTVEALD
jgi:threonine dehydratase